ncbi:MAG: HlyC/CorC family transporter [Clostridia bacterium]|nr:HlyC/CorC family transporter [Clostridia bacterium]
MDDTQYRGIMPFDDPREVFGHMVDPLGPSILLVLFLFFAAAVYMASIALPSADEAEYKRSAAQGSTNAKRILRLLSRFDRGYGELRLTYQLLITASYICLWNLTGDWLRQLTGLSATLSAIILMLVYEIVAFAATAVIPSGFAAHSPDRVLRGVSSFALFALSVCSVVTWPALMLGRGVLGLFHLEPGRASERVTEEDIRMMVDIGEEKGAIEADEKEMIENIFEFNNMTAEDCMIHRKDITAISIDSEPEEVLQVIAESGLSRFPVYEETIDNVVGVLTTRDFLLSRCSSDPKGVRELIRPAHFVPESVRADVLFNEMQSRKQHMAIVIDEYGGTSGLVTLEDLLEEIVGNIYDEFDPKEEQDITPLGDDRWRVAGWVDLETLNETIGCEIPLEEEYDTLGGLVFSRLTTIPADGEHPVVECFGLRISVSRISERRVEWAVVEKLAETGAAEAEADE